MDIDNLIDDICKDIKNDKKTAKNNDFGQDQDKKPNKNSDLVQPGFEKTETRGRKNKGLTNAHYEQYKNDKRTLRNIKQSDNFKSDIIEKIQGEVIQADDLQTFAEMYKLTCDCVLDDFKSNNADLVKKHPYMWYKNLLIQLKKEVPAITADDIDKIYIVWDCLKYLLNSIGLYITYEVFLDFTHIYDYQIKDRQKLNPKYIDVVKKINNDRDNALLNEIAFNPYNQTNKIFLAKCHGIIEKTEPKTIEVNYNIKNYDNISNYRLSDNGKN